jgi:hypothetical protein
LSYLAVRIQSHFKHTFPLTSITFQEAQLAVARRLLRIGTGFSTNLETRVLQITAGVRTGELMEWFEQEENYRAYGWYRPVGLSSDVILDNVRYGGVVANGCHVRSVPKSTSLSKSPCEELTNQLL